MNEVLAALTIFGCVVAICGTAFGISVRLSGGKQKPMCIALFREFKEAIEQVKVDSGSFVTMESCKSKIIARDKQWDRELKSTSEIHEEKFKRLEASITSLSALHEEKFTSLSNQFRGFEGDLQEIKQDIKSNRELFLQTIQDYQNAFNEFRNGKEAR
jgi:hypothetical protein